MLTRQLICCSLIKNPNDCDIIVMSQMLINKHFPQNIIVFERKTYMLHEDS